MGNKNLIIITNKGEKISVIDSREVAKMLKVQHDKLLEDIREIISVLNKEGINAGDYFIEDVHDNFYLCTKNGCLLLGNKQETEESIKFTAKIVWWYNEMEQKLKMQVVEDPYTRALRWAEEHKGKMLSQEEVKSNLYLK